MTNRETLRSLAEQPCPLEICAAPGCLNMTSGGICDECNDWVSAEVAKLNAGDTDDLDDADDRDLEAGFGW